MSWNHRVLLTKADYIGEFWYSIHEVHYNEDGSVARYGINPAVPYGETLEELAEDIERFKKALEKPVLELIDNGKTVEMVHED